MIGIISGFVSGRERRGNSESTGKDRKELENRHLVVTLAGAIHKSRKEKYTDKRKILVSSRGEGV